MRGARHHACFHTHTHTHTDLHFADSPPLCYRAECKPSGPQLRSDRGARRGSEPAGAACFFTADSQFSQLPVRFLDDATHLFFLEAVF